ncbi:unnamed protein product [Acidithrix sp. C25]|nr:unnamed protein product [Acidithrix sp. C25]
MAAEALENAANEAGYEIHVETQGAAGIDAVETSDITSADVVIFAADVQVRERERFVGAVILEVGVKRAINEAHVVIEEAIALAQSQQKSPNKDEEPVDQLQGDGLVRSDEAKPDSENSFLSSLRQWLMTGLSYAIPLIACGGVLTTISYSMAGTSIASRIGSSYGGANSLFGNINVIYGHFGVAGVLYSIGAFAFVLTIPILSGYISFAIADRPGLVPGLVGGLIAGAMGGGYIGGIVVGVGSGLLVQQLLRIKVPSILKPILPTTLLPVISTLVVGGLLFVFLGTVLRDVTNAILKFVNGLNSPEGLVLGLALGSMMAFDSGGPINKVAYTIGVALLLSGNLKVMAAIIVAGVVPPVGLALAVKVRPKLFTPPELKVSSSALTKGLALVTEQAIPFAMADPKNARWSAVAGSAIAASLSMYFGSTAPVPHGGVLVVWLMGRPGPWIAALAIGILITFTSAIVTKSRSVGSSIMSPKTNLLQDRP